MREIELQTFSQPEIKPKKPNAFAHDKKITSSVSSLNSFALTLREQILDCLAGDSLDLSEMFNFDLFSNKSPADIPKHLSDKLFFSDLLHPHYVNPHKQPAIRALTMLLELSVAAQPDPQAQIVLVDLVATKRITFSNYRWLQLYSLAEVYVRKLTNEQKNKKDQLYQAKDFFELMVFSRRFFYNIPVNLMGYNKKNLLWDLYFSPSPQNAIDSGFLDKNCLFLLTIGKPNAIHKLLYSPLVDQFSIKLLLDIAQFSIQHQDNRHQEIVLLAARRVLVSWRAKIDDLKAAVQLIEIVANTYNWHNIHSNRMAKHFEWVSFRALSLHDREFAIQCLQKAIAFYAKLNSSSVPNHSLKAIIRLCVLQQNVSPELSEVQDIKAIPIEGLPKFDDMERLYHLINPAAKQRKLAAYRLRQAIMFSMKEHNVSEKKPFFLTEFEHAIVREKAIIKSPESIRSYLDVLELNHKSEISSDVYFDRPVSDTVPSRDPDQFYLDLQFNKQEELRTGMSPFLGELTSGVYEEINYGTYSTLLRNHYKTFVGQTNCSDEKLRPFAAEKIHDLDFISKMQEDFMEAQIPLADEKERKLRMFSPAMKTEAFPKSKSFYKDKIPLFPNNDSLLAIFIYFIESQTIKKQVSDSKRASKLKLLYSCFEHDRMDDVAKFLKYHGLSTEFLYKTSHVAPSFSLSSSSSSSATSAIPATFFAPPTFPNAEKSLKKMKSKVSQILAFIELNSAETLNAQEIQDSLDIHIFKQGLMKLNDLLEKKWGRSEPLCDILTECEDLMPIPATQSTDQISNSRHGQC